MNNFHKLIFISLIVLLYRSIIYGSFEYLPSGARMRSLGDAFVSVADDIETMLVQPAGIANIGYSQLSLIHGQSFLGSSGGIEKSNNTILIAAPTGVGLGYSTTDLKQKGHEDTIFGSFALKIAKNIFFGANVKLLNKRFGSEYFLVDNEETSQHLSKTNIDIDAGIIFKVLPLINAAYSCQNVLETDMGLDVEDRTKRSDKIGVAYKRKTFLITIEGAFRKSDSQLLSGIEKTFFKKAVSIRIGYGLGDNETSKISSGLGINFKRLSIDYACDYQLSGIEKTSGTHYLMVSINLSKKLISDSPISSKVRLENRQTMKEPLTAPIPDIIPTPKKIGIEEINNDEQIKEIKKNLDINSNEKPAPVVLEVGTNTYEPVKLYTEKPRLKQASFGYISNKMHKVAGGDTLPLLAEKYYGNKSKWVKIYEANKDRIEKGSLKPGDIIIIPE